MTEYEIVSFTNANHAERQLLMSVEVSARQIARERISNQRAQHGHEPIAAAAKALELTNVRAAFLNTQMELAALHANIDRAQSQFAELTDRVESEIYGYALALAEMAVA